MFKSGDLVRGGVYDPDPMGFGVVLGPDPDHNGWYKIYYGKHYGIVSLPKSCLRLAKPT